MSQRTGIPLSTLAKVEHDRLTLTYDKLQQLSERLKIRMSELFAEPGEGPEPPSRRAGASGASTARCASIRATTITTLCAELRRKRMIPVLTKIRAKSVSEFGELVHHSGEEYIYVLEGRIEIHTEFYDPIVLEAGESIYIDSNMGHAYVAAEGCEQATVLGVCSSADEGLMESLLELHGDEEVEPTAPAGPGRLSSVARARRKGRRRARTQMTKGRRRRPEEARPTDAASRPRLSRLAPGPAAHSRQQAFSGLYPSSRGE